MKHFSSLFDKRFMKMMKSLTEKIQPDLTFNTRNLVVRSAQVLSRLKLMNLIRRLKAVSI